MELSHREPAKVVEAAPLKEEAVIAALEGASFAEVPSSPAAAFRSAAAPAGDADKSHAEPGPSRVCGHIRGRTDGAVDCF